MSIREDFPYNMICLTCGEVAFWVDKPFQSGDLADSSRVRLPGGERVKDMFIQCPHCHGHIGSKFVDYEKVAAC